MNADARIERALSERMGRDVRVVFTDNRHTMLSFRERREGIFTLRLHGMFRDADDAVLGALARYLAHGRRRADARAIDDFLRENAHRVRGRRRGPQGNARPRGTFFDLRKVFDELNRDYFGGAIRAEITWGRYTLPRDGQRSIRLGTYSDYADGPVIRVHPALDHGDVPACVVERVVFHEMLHQVFGLRPGRLHPPEMDRAERRYRGYRKAMNWETKNLDWLLGRRQLAFHLPEE
jgi:hypothetical protein